ncbi:uncharacterized protein LOC123204939 [Mangifera indica]|uniref:uncharacterized protein LOC123204939 n=1 Tax=Mangifera indica TaxID=29780 RepID=UPI001CFB9388|nr:uncharacterized protein LOC123204939 [Mangifera indica]
MRHSSCIQCSSSLCTRSNTVSEMAESSLFRRLLVTSLVFSLLVSLNAVPVTRIGNFMNGSQVYELLEKTPLVTGEKSWEKNTIVGRMGVELNDYPGSGANNRHTPRTQLGRGCVDC